MNNEERRQAFLVLSRWNPFGSIRGGDIDYSRGLIESLSAVGDVTVLSFDHPQALNASTPEKIRWATHQSRSRSRLVGLLSRYPNVAYRHQDEDFLQAAITAASNADVVIIDFIGMFWLVAPLRKALLTLPHRPALIVINHNVEADVRRQMAAGTSGIAGRVLAYDAEKAARLEREANLMADGLIAITETDRAIFARLADKPSIAVTPGYNGPAVEHRVISANLQRRVAILGNFEAHHKRMVLDRTIDALRQTKLRGDVVVDVVGAGDFSDIDPPAGVTFQGFVPDIRAYLETVRLGVLCDVIGGGFKLRLLTYAFCRVPIIAIPEAIEGSGLRPDEHFIAIVTLDELSGAIAAAIDDLDRLNAIQSAAFKFVTANYDWNDRGRDIDVFARSLVSTISRPTPETMA